MSAEADVRATAERPWQAVVGGQAVLYYRLYHLKENRFIGVDDFEAQGDAQALNIAKTLNGIAVSELWESGRKIIPLQPNEDAA